MDIHNKKLTKQIVSLDNYVLKQLYEYCKIIVGIEEYDAIHNTVLFLRIIPILLNIECKFMTNLEVTRLIIKI